MFIFLISYGIMLAGDYMRQEKEKAILVGVNIDYQNNFQKLMDELEKDNTYYLTEMGYIVIGIVK